MKLGMELWLQIVVRGFNSAACRRRLVLKNAPAQCALSSLSSLFLGRFLHCFVSPWKVRCRQGNNVGYITVLQHQLRHLRASRTKFLCSEVIAPVKSEVDDIYLYIINFEDLSSPPPTLEDPSANHRLSKFDRARASFRQSLRMPLRGRGLRLTGYLTPPTAEEEQGPEDEQRKKEAQRQSLRMPLRGRGLRLTGYLTPPTAEEEQGPEDEQRKKEAQSRLSGDASTTTVTERGLRGQESPARIHQGANHVPRTPSTTAPIASPEQMSQRSVIIPWEEEGSGGVPHSSSMDALSRAQRVSDPPPPKAPIRSATVGVPAPRNHVAKCFPNTSSESDLQKYRASSIWDHPLAPSLSNIAAEGLRHKYSIQDNGSAKLFQGAMHTPNMGEKVAQTWVWLAFGALKSALDILAARGHTMGCRGKRQLSSEILCEGWLGADLEGGWGSLAPVGAWQTRRIAAQRSAVSFERSTEADCRRLMSPTRVATTEFSAFRCQLSVHPPLIRVTALPFARKA
ncbi:hypothetical protein LSTR_LSTR004935 [Laodelphax striatellus]|uniref:Uncharacterized protein n=1 Tax=Laodelphax striatellus TaxID=195883 RepID=A0A482XMT6_LAOST|nr:hypothetical protein LSTR_LSTR004935 [Laodelphax striatellus]